ncbi:hypothetical protein M5689_023260 [Euphorbia peplus]|nr:hypothetical protein M5689_023260 [Euphorbia peplus]
MKGASKVIMGATLVMVVTLAIVLGLVLVLLAELYCTLLLRRRRQHRHLSNGGETAVPAPAPTTVESANGNNVLTHPSHVQNQVPRSFTPGVLEAPRNLFYPSIKENKTQESRKLHTILQMHIQESKSCPLAASSSPNEVQIQVKDVKDHEPIVYISNPIYDNNNVVVETPFETPDSSPSRLETGSPGSGSSCSGGEDEVSQSKKCVTTPPLTPMKKLPAEASSVSLRDARSLGTSASDSVSHNGLSSSSSGSPSTSPSW